MMIDTITDQNATVAELSAEQKLKLESLQLKIRVCELTQALASAEKHIYELEYKGVLNDQSN